MNEECFSDIEELWRFLPQIIYLGGAFLGLKYFCLNIIVYQA